MSAKINIVVTLKMGVESPEEAAAVFGRLNEPDASSHLLNQIAVMSGVDTISNRGIRASISAE